MKLIGVKTNNGYYITESPSYETALCGYLINGERPQETFNKRWVFTTSEPKILEKYCQQPSINYRYELIDPVMANDKIPSVLERDNVTEMVDGDRTWKKELGHLQSLYLLQYDKQPDILEIIPFEFRIAIEVDVIKEPRGFRYSTVKSFNESGSDVTEKDVIYQVLDTILFPDILLHERPCKLTSKQTYKIIRSFVKDNINPQYAEITSDYYFCFVVMKKVPLTDPIPYQVDVNQGFLSKRKRPPKYVTRYKDSRSFQIFEMTSEEDHYKDYTPIQGFQAENSDALKDTIDSYLAKLITIINEPVQDCPKCKGAGVLFSRKVGE